MDNFSSILSSGGDQGQQFVWNQSLIWNVHILASRSWHYLLYTLYSDLYMDHLWSITSSVMLLPYSFAGPLEIPVSDFQEN